MNNVAVCLSPELIHLFDLEGKTVVVVDILRATSCMVTGFAQGLDSMRPMASLDECLAQRSAGYIIAGERGGQKVEGFDIGNSPFSYQDAKIKGSKVAVTTTNGTLAITKSKLAAHVLIGAFLNIRAVAARVKELGNDLIIHCAGWRGAVNAEDTLFSGALIELLKDKFVPESDDAKVAHAVYLQHQSTMFDFVASSSHAQRLSKFGILEDIKFCLIEDKFDIVPYLDGDDLKA